LSLTCYSDLLGVSKFAFTCSVYRYAETNQARDEHPLMEELRATVAQERQRAAAGTAGVAGMSGGGGGGNPNNLSLTGGYDAAAAGMYLSPHARHRHRHQHQHAAASAYGHGGHGMMGMGAQMGTGMGMGMGMGQMGMGMPMGQMGMGQVGYGGGGGVHSSYGVQPVAHPAAAAAFNAATGGGSGGGGGDPTRDKEAARRERRERKEREQHDRERESSAAAVAASHQSSRGSIRGDAHGYDGPLSPHQGNVNAANAATDKENKEVRRRERDEKARAAAKHAAEEHITAMEATHRIAVKGLQRRVANLEHELATKDESFENEHMRLEVEVNRAIIDKVEAERARLDEERAAMQADLQSAIDLERQLAAEEATKAVREADAENSRKRELEASRLAAREEALSEELTTERSRTSELISIISQQSRDLAKGGSDVANHLVALEQAASLKEAEARRVLDREREAMVAEKTAELRAAEERGRVSAEHHAARAASEAAAAMEEVRRSNAVQLAAAVGAAEAAAATGAGAESDRLKRALEDERSRASHEAAKRNELERLLDAAERRVEAAAAEAATRAASTASSAAASDAEVALQAERRKARYERARWASTFIGMRTTIQQLRGVQDRLRAEAAAAAAAAGQGMAAALDSVGVLGRSARLAVDRFAVVQKERRALSNKLLELKGNIRVFLRIRPLSGGERSNGDFAALTAVSSLEAQIAAAAPGAGPGPGPGAGRRFEMDHVIGPDIAQSEVFEEVEPLIKSVLDGYNVCIFAYGQTGSGKTHTMEGTEADRGITFRALAALFREAASEWAGYSYEFEVTMLEVYNDKVRDLLELDPSKPRQHDVRQGPQGAFVTDLEHVRVSTSMDVMRVMRQGGAARKTGKTNMNEHSSRSHLVFAIIVKGVNKARGETVESRLNLVDLAGSERLSKTGATGERLAEAQHINKSLSALGNCMAALATRQQKSQKGVGGKAGGGAGHVPFRDCKLTHILSPCLGGDSKTLMFVHAGPAVGGLYALPGVRLVTLDHDSCHQLVF
jgi:kinesin family protein C2/C3